MSDFEVQPIGTGAELERLRKRERELIRAGNYLVNEIGEDDIISAGTRNAAINWEKVVNKHKEQSE